jgi:hypothetical protein
VILAGIMVPGQILIVPLFLEVDGGAPGGAGILRRRVDV